MLNNALIKWITYRHTVFTRKSAYARKSASLEFWREILNEHLPQMSTPFFSEKGTILDKSLETNLQS